MTHTPNKFVRLLVVILSILLIILIVYNFFFTDPSGIISSGLIALIAILVVVALSESFDRFSVGQLISISRDNKKKETELTRISGENLELRAQLVSVTTAVSQSQTSTNIFGVPADLIKGLTIEPATEDEIAEKDEEPPESQQIVRPRRIDKGKLAQIALRKFADKKDLDVSAMLTEVKMVPQFRGVDPISNTQPVFDGYMNTRGEELFVEIQQERVSLTFFRDRLYRMLSKIYFYRSLKDANAYLALVLVKIPSEKERRSRRQRLEEDFAPAITNGLLRISRIELSEDDLSGLYHEYR